MSIFTDTHVHSAAHNCAIVENEIIVLVDKLTVGSDKRLAACARTKLEEAKFYMRELIRQREERMTATATQGEK
jgi:hypothetical protein